MPFCFFKSLFFCVKDFRLFSDLLFPIHYCHPILLFLVTLLLVLYAI